MRWAAIVLSVLLPLLAGCAERADPATAGITIHGVALTPGEVRQLHALSPLPPPPPNPTNRVADDPRAQHLGRFLFFDPQLSAGGETSCATCHQPDRAFTDGEPVPEGLRRNTPTLWNVAHHRWMFWDGRRDSLWAQTLVPLEHPDEMATTRVALWRRVANDEALRRAYEAIFGPLPALATATLPTRARPVPGRPSHPEALAWEALPETDRRAIDHLAANLGKALEAYERTLIRADSPFDRFVAALRTGAGDPGDQLSAPALRGAKLFVGRGRCTLCHTGPFFSDGEFHNLGLEHGAGIDTGRFGGIPEVKGDPFNGLGVESDDPSVETNAKVHYVVAKPNNLGEFKTPSLRNVAETAPYMHDGRFATLEEGVRFYSTLDERPALGHREETLVPLGWSEEEIRDVVAFLESLTGAPAAPAMVTPPEGPMPEDRE